MHGVFIALCRCAFRFLVCTVWVFVWLTPVAAPAPPGNVQSFIDSTGLMSATWGTASIDSGVTQYNMEYRVLNSDVSNQVGVPVETPMSNVSGLMISVFYEVSSYFPCSHCRHSLVLALVTALCCAYTLTTDVDLTNIPVIQHTRMDSDQYW